MDLFAIIRETIFLAVGIPVLVYCIRVLLTLGGKSTMAKMFLRHGLTLRFSKLLVVFSSFAFVTSVFLYLYVSTEFDPFRIVGGVFGMGSAVMMLLALKTMYEILR